MPLGPVARDGATVIHQRFLDFWTLERPANGSWPEPVGRWHLPCARADGKARSKNRVRHDQDFGLLDLGALGGRPRGSPAIGDEGQEFPTRGAAFVLLRASAAPAASMPKWWPLGATGCP